MMLSWDGQGGCERRSEALKYFWRGGGVGGWIGAVRVDVNREVKLL